MSTTIPALRALGVNARAWEFMYKPSAINSYDNVRFIRKARRDEHLRGWYTSALIAGIVAWADVVHWYCKRPDFPRGGDVHSILRRFGRPGVVEWRGSDIRNPEVDRIDNAVWRAFEQTHPGETEIYGTASGSAALQRIFSDLGFETVVPPGMLQYVLPELRSRTHIVQRAVEIQGVAPKYPSPLERVPLVMHAPSTQLVKGTAHVTAATQQLMRDDSLRFELISGQAHAAALERIAECDVFIDQMILGDYGIAAIEAMALGKPVVCYLKPSIVAAYPDDLPVVSATPDTLADVLATLISDGLLRERLGQEGRRYVEANHSPQLRAAQLKDVYDSLS